MGTFICNKSKNMHGNDAVTLEYHLTLGRVGGKERDGPGWGGGVETKMATFQHLNLKLLSVILFSVLF